MTFTFDSSLATERDEVRLKIGDTQSALELLSDETIDALLSANDDDVLATSIAATKAILARLSRDTDRSAIGFSTSRSQAVTQYRDLLADLEKERDQLAGAMYVGGSSTAEIERITGDSDAPAPIFSIGMDDYTGD